MCATNATMYNSASAVNMLYVRQRHQLVMNAAIIATMMLVKHYVQLPTIIGEYFSERYECGLSLPNDQFHTVMHLNSLSTSFSSTK